MGSASQGRWLALRAEAAAEKFQAMLAKPAKSCLVADESKAKGAANGK